MKNDLAFPETTGEVGTKVQKGLTKREYFAALALTGAIVKPGGLNAEELAEYAVKHADALIKELEKENEI